MKQRSCFWAFLYGTVCLLSSCRQEADHNISHESTTVRIDSADVNIGGVRPRTSHSVPYKIYNTGQQPLHITQILPSCECTRAAYDKQITAPGEYVTVTLTYEAEEFSGSFFRTADVECNVDTAVVLTLTGFIVNE